MLRLMKDMIRKRKVYTPDEIFAIISPIAER